VRAIERVLATELAETIYAQIMDRLLSETSGSNFQNKSWRCRSNIDRDDVLIWEVLYLWALNSAITFLATSARDGAAIDVEVEADKDGRGVGIVADADILQQHTEMTPTVLARPLPLSLLSGT
jgi:hypothetical protein